MQAEPTPYPPAMTRYIARGIVVAFFATPLAFLGMWMFCMLRVNLALGLVLGWMPATFAAFLAILLSVTAWPLIGLLLTFIFIFTALVEGVVH